MKKKSLPLIHLITYALCFGSQAYAQSTPNQEPSSNTSSSNTSSSTSTEDRVIKIDDPSFRKLVVAFAESEIVPKNDPELLAIQNQIKSDLPYLLQFSGLFKMLGAEAFAGKTQQQEADELAFWKMLSTDSVLKAKLTRKSKVLKLEFTGLDVYRSRVLETKSYDIRSKDQAYQALKRYVDFLLEIYTGKPGIFQSKIVFSGKKNHGSPKEIFACDPDGRNLEKITNFPALHLSPSWDPSGRKIIYTSYRGGMPDLYIQDYLSKRLTPISGPKGWMNTGGAYSPNGKIIAFTGIKTGIADIYVVPTTGGPRRALLKGNSIDVDPVFSPDGKWLAYASGRYGNPHIFKLELAWNSDLSDVKVKSDTRLTFSGWWNAMPAWSPNSQKIAFGGFDRDINRFDLFIMNHDGSKLERLTLETGDNKSPSFSPNGQLIVFHSNRNGTVSGRGQSQLYIMNQDGSSQRIITTGLYEAEDPKWGPYSPIK